MAIFDPVDLVGVAVDVERMNRESSALQPDFEGSRAVAVTEQPAGVSGEVLGREVVVVDRDGHGSRLGGRLAGDPAVDVDVAAPEEDGLAGQADDALDVGLGRVGRVLEDRDFPAPGRPEVIKELLDEQAVAQALGRRGMFKLGLAAVRADGPARAAVLVHAKGEPLAAVRAEDVAMHAQKRRGHRAGGHDVGLGREPPGHQDAEHEDDQELDRRAQSAMAGRRRRIGGCRLCRVPRCRGFRAAVGRACEARRFHSSGAKRRASHALLKFDAGQPSLSSSTDRNASCEISTLPICFIRFLPSFCFSSSFRLRETSPP